MMFLKWSTLLFGSRADGFPDLLYILSRDDCMWGFAVNYVVILSTRFESRKSASLLALWTNTTAAWSMQYQSGKLKFPSACPL